MEDWIAKPEKEKIMVWNPEKKEWRVL